MSKYQGDILAANFRKGRLLKYLYREYKGMVTTYPENKKWLFILGCYNSGTTLLHDLLAQADKIASLPGEGQFLTNKFLLPSHVKLSRMWVKNINRFYLNEQSSEPDPTKVKKQWTSYFNDPGRPIYMEKSPTDIARIKWYNRYFDNPYFIGIIRNGYAVAEGIKRKAGFGISDATDQWRISNETMLKDLEGIENKLIIKYEDLTDNTDVTLEKIFNFLELETVRRSEKEVMEIHGVSSRIRNMNTVSFANLTNEDIKAIEETGRDMLNKFHYTLEV